MVWHRDWGQLGFADHMVMRHGRPNELLTRVAELIDWAALARIVSVLHDSPHGAPAYPPLAMVKALLLQQWYGLSDPGLEEALWDRLSFRVFCGCRWARPRRTIRRSTGSATRFARRGWTSNCLTRSTGSSTAAG
jgi:transposase, IS5 family